MTDHVILRHPRGSDLESILLAYKPGAVPAPRRPQVFGRLLDAVLQLGEGMETATGWILEGMLRGLAQYACSEDGLGHDLLLADERSRWEEETVRCPTSRS